MTQKRTAARPGSGMRGIDAKAAAPRPLTPRQELFVLEYLKDLNGTQAAIRAGYSRRTANEQAARLLAKPSVAAAVAEAMAERKERVRIDTDELEWQAERIAAADIRKMARGGAFLALEEIPDDLAPAISSIEVVTKDVGKGEIENLAKVRFWDKNAALRLLFQIRGYGHVNEKHVNVKGELAIREVGSAHQQRLRVLEDAELAELVQAQDTVARILSLADARLAAREG